MKRSSTELIALVTVAGMATLLSSRSQGADDKATIPPSRHIAKRNFRSRTEQSLPLCIAVTPRPRKTTPFLVVPSPLFQALPRISNSWSRIPQNMPALVAGGLATSMQATANRATRRSSRPAGLVTRRQTRATLSLHTTHRNCLTILRKHTEGERA